METPQPMNFYCNIATAGFSNYDFRVELGQTTPTSQPGQISPEDLRAVAIMSPQHFKAFVLAMNTSLRQFEQVFGPINLEPNQQAMASLETESKVDRQ